MSSLEEWFSARGFTPAKFQRETWAAYAAGKSGLIHVPTGSGKTLAAFGGPLKELRPGKGLQILYLSPLRAVIRDVEKVVTDVCSSLSPAAIIESRTGDSPAKTRAKQRKRLPDILLTTPESLSLLLSKPDFREKTTHLRCVILDEWHELLGSKRGIQVELALSRILPMNPDARVWALSGTLANLDEAARYAVGLAREPHIVSEKIARPLVIKTLIPRDPRTVPWTGHLGMRLLPSVLSELDQEKSTLIFTNTRSQAELWFQAILEAKPEMAGAIALHHSSLATKTRWFVEESLKNGSIKWVVCTSSLDLGVDFGPVELVFQIGSAKGISRLLQRAGRANHRPGEPSEIHFVPTQALEVLEIAAVRAAVEKNLVESRRPPRGAVDVLEQHLVTLACAKPFSPDEVFSEVKNTVSYSELSREIFDWVLNHLLSGGSLSSYPQFRKLEIIDGKVRVASPLITRFHRMSIGTIVSDALITVYLSNRKKIGVAEERYLSRMKSGDTFLFAGRTLEFIMIRDMKAYARPSRGKPATTARWLGGKLPISDSLSHELRALLSEVKEGNLERLSLSERAVLEPLLDTQKIQSGLPNENEILFEFSQSREGGHCFIFPFEGRLVHEGLASLLAYRLGRIEKSSFGLSMSDYGIELLSDDRDYPFQTLFTEHGDALFSEVNLLPDLVQSIQIGEFSKRHFREIARISGMIFQGYPGSEKTARQLQVSSSLIYDVLEKYEPENLLFKQSRSEVVERQFEWDRLLRAMDRIRRAKILMLKTPRFSPFAFSLVFERMAGKVSTETLQERLAKMAKKWTAATGVG
ncbi:MAG: ligase-associated DNA damage response DEXH box helicase [Cryobacterium sp.]|nr:ligase-associated DNA damage response DEXH box helicase [Oligoflexia bacterium]